MLLSEKLCRLCGDNFEAFVFFHAIKDIPVIRKLELPLSSDDDRICGFCYSLIDKIQKFCDQTVKVQDFFTFLSTVHDLTEKKINEIRHEYDINLRKNQATDTNVLILDESLTDSKNVEKLVEINNTSFTLAEFSEISTISLNDQSFLIESVEVEQNNDDDITEEIHISYDTTVNTENEGNESFKVEQSEDINYRFICHVCNEEFSNFFGLYNHVRKLHDTIPQVQCVCDKILSTRAQLNLHKKLHSSMKSFKCELCHKIYNHQQSLQNHLKKSHSNENTSIQFTCNKCQRSFENEKKLVAHEQIHNQDNFQEKKVLLPCPFPDCDKKFTKSVNVQTHVKTVHVKERPFLCSDCGKSFGTKGALKEHQIIHSSDYPYSCKFCSKKFKNLPRKNTHEDTHQETGVYICTVCGLALNTKRTLKMHVVVHSDNKKFKCKFCQSTFKRSKALKNHLILHLGLRPYSCNFCEKTFANGSNCRSHKKKAHPEELKAFEASGKMTSAPNIPRLEQLLSNSSESRDKSEQKNDGELSLLMDGSSIII